MAQLKQNAILLEKLDGRLVITLNRPKVRNALSFAARTEEPYVSKHIADVLMAIETIKDTHNYLANLKDVMGEDKYS